MKGRERQREREKSKNESPTHSILPRQMGLGQGEAGSQEIHPGSHLRCRDPVFETFFVDFQHIASVSWCGNLLAIELSPIWDSGIIGEQLNSYTKRPTPHLAVLVLNAISFYSSCFSDNLG